MTFSSDDYNKTHNASVYPQCNHGTLIGNWQEEREIRYSTGEGRSIPQRHIKRSGLLKDFTRQLDQTQAKKQDNTFERVYGGLDCKDKIRPTNMSYGNGAKFAEEDDFCDWPILYAFSDTKPIREKIQEKQMVTVVEAVAKEDAEKIEAQREIRHFDCSSEVYNYKAGQKAEHAKPSAIKTLFTGPATEEKNQCGNQGLRADLGVNYSLQNAVTHGSEKMGKRGKLNNDGVSRVFSNSVFNKNATFSTPVELYLDGACKTADLVVQDQAANSTVPASVTQEPYAHLLKKVPQLSDLKQHIKECVTAFAFADDDTTASAVNHNMAKFRSQLQSKASEGFISIADFKQALVDVGATNSDVVFKPWMDRVSSVKKGHVRIEAICESLRCVDCFTSDESLAVWTSLSQDNAVSVSAFVAAFNEDEQAAAISGLASLGYVADGKMSRKQVCEYLGDVLSCNKTEVVRGALSGVTWA